MSLIQEVPRVRVAGNSDAMREVERAALKAAAGDANILITGERGVGKGVLARFIHDESDRSPQGYGVINCKGLPDMLFESELFGHLQGSIGGAYRDKPGMLKSVPGGTIFLDEVSALSKRMQTRLLRSIETGEHMRFGIDGVRVWQDVRVIASTEVDLRAHVSAGLFLETLYERLTVVTLRVPSLRERRDDIPALIDHFAGQFSATPHISAAAREALCSADWPGNIKDLKSAVLKQVLFGSVGAGRAMAS